MQEEAGKHGAAPTKILVPDVEGMRSFCQMLWLGCRTCRPTLTPRWP